MGGFRLRVLSLGFVLCPCLNSAERFRTVYVFSYYCLCRPMMIFLLLPNVTIADAKNRHWSMRSRCKRVIFPDTAGGHFISDIYGC